ncbi:MAG: TMEM165/GDT1 family protein [Rhodospirillales bacterium]|nr:TMEM165/GDT1 family protein [Rhodospirillales bacterium]
MEILSIFASVFVAELGDETQIATLLFAAGSDQRPLFIFLAAASALVVSTGAAVLIGSQGQQWLENFPMRAVAGAGFLVIGTWMMWDHFQA